MSMNTHRPPATRMAGPCVDADLRELADQLQRCTASQGPARRLRNLADPLRSFASRHVTSLAAMVVLAAAAISRMS